VKKVGIAADDFKLEKFKSELNKAGFNDFTIKKFTVDTSFIQVNVQDSDVPEVAKICKRVELYFKRSN
jgi:hypothetical protein